MEEKYFFVPKNNDSVFNIVFSRDRNSKIKNTELEIEIDQFNYKVYKVEDIFIISCVSLKNNPQLNTDIWQLDNLQILESFLRNIFTTDKIIVAIHWGGKDYDSSAKQTKQFVDINNKLKEGEIFLTYYSEHHDKITGLNDLVRLVPAIKERVESKTDLKKTLINLWLPLAIDIQGLKDDNRNHFKDYFLAIQKDVKEYGNDEYLKSWEELKTIMPESLKKNIIENDIPSKIVKKLTSDINPEDFYNNFITVNEKHFFPNWLQDVVCALDEKIKNSN